MLPVNFEESFELLIGVEGRFSDDDNDPGNWTGGKVGKGQMKGSKYGVSAAAYPHLDIVNLTLEDAKAIYLKDYWDQSGCHLVPGCIAYLLFDMAVNSGPITAKKQLQEAMKVEADGIIGPKTLAAIKAKDPLALTAHFVAERLAFYTSAAIWPSQGKGWVNRMVTILRRF